MVGWLVLTLPAVERVDGAIGGGLETVHVRAKREETNQPPRPKLEDDADRPECTPSKQTKREKRLVVCMWAQRGWVSGGLGGWRAVGKRGYRAVDADGWRGGYGL